MKVIDLTHTIKVDMPVFPGTDQPKLDSASTLEKDGFRETLLTMYSHTGTHMDAPYHVRDEGITLDKFPADKFVGKALIVDCSDLEEGYTIGISYIEKYKDIIDEAEYVIFKTGWEKYWNEQKYFGNFPVIDEEVADYLIKSNKKGIGLDVISIEPISEEELPMHHKILKNNLVIIENLCNLDSVGDKLFTFCALPLKYENSDGASVRAIAMLD